MRNKRVGFMSLAFFLFFLIIILTPCPSGARIKAGSAEQLHLAAIQSDDSIELIIEILRSDEPEMQAMAISMVRDMPSAEVTKALIKELPNLSVTGQIQLLSALADRGDAVALPAVVTAAKSQEQTIRIAALKALGQLGDASSVTLLSHTAANSRGEQQKAARESLYRLRGSEVDKAILKEILSADNKVMVELIRAVGHRNITAGVQTLLKTAQDSDSKVQLESFKVLKVVADEKCLPKLVELLLEIKNETVRSEAEKTIAAVAHKIKDKNRRAEAVLAALPSVKDTKKRCSLISVLGRIGDDSALQTLRDILRGDDEIEKYAAIRALSDWPNAKPLDDLLKITKASQNEIHRILALRGFVRLIGLKSDNPPEETIEMYELAMNLARSVTEKRMVLSGLANVESPAALVIAAGYLDNKALQTEAEVAVLKIAEAIYRRHPQQTEDALDKIIQTSQSESMRKRARQIVKQIDNLKAQTR